MVLNIIISSIKKIIGTLSHRFIDVVLLFPSFIPICSLETFNLEKNTTYIITSLCVHFPFVL